MRSSIARSFLGDEAKLRKHLLHLDALPIEIIPQHLAVEIHVSPEVANQIGAPLGAAYGGAEHKSPECNLLRCKLRRAARPAPRRHNAIYSAPAPGLFAPCWSTRIRP